MTQSHKSSLFDKTVQKHDKSSESGQKQKLQLWSTAATDRNREGMKG